MGESMTIHVIQNGDTIKSIAEKYNVPVKRLEIDNDLAPYANLSIGHALMITHPLETYIAKEGDTLDSIAEAFDVTKAQSRVPLGNGMYGYDFSYELIDGRYVLQAYIDKGIFPSRDENNANEQSAFRTMSSKIL